jgi:hypothetical protein
MCKPTHQSPTELTALTVQPRGVTDYRHSKDPMVDPNPYDSSFHSGSLFIMQRKRKWLGTAVRQVKSEQRRGRRRSQPAALALSSFLMPADLLAFDCNEV